MTQKDKILLLKDLCARLPYGVKGLHRGKVHELFTIDGRVISNTCIQVDGYDAWFPIDTFKPYLHPMSSMTDDEKREYNYTKTLSIQDYPTIKTYDWLNEHMFDFRGLIEKGLAIEAPEGMYEIKYLA